MAYPLSERLNRVLGHGAWKPGAEVSLRQLRISAADEFGDDKQCVLALTQGEDVGMRYGRLMLYLIKLVEQDSAVRDVITVGHLAKLLSRLHLFKCKVEYKVAAWPNPLFDRQAQKERNEYFRRTVGLPTSVAPAENPTLVELCAREHEILVRFGILTK